MGVMSCSLRYKHVFLCCVNMASDKLQAVYHVFDWPRQVSAQHNRFLCESVYLKQGRANFLDFLRP